MVNSVTSWYPGNLFSKTPGTGSVRVELLIWHMVNHFVFMIICLLFLCCFYTNIIKVSAVESAHNFCLFPAGKKFVLIFSAFLIFMRKFFMSQR